MSRSRSPPPSPSAPPVVGHSAAFARDPLGYVEESVDEVGDVFRLGLLGRDLTVVANPDHVETALLDRETFAKLDDFTVALGDSLLSVEGADWRRQRHANEPFFEPGRIREHAATMRDVAAARVDRWPSSGTVGVDDEARAAALEILFEVVLGDELEDGSYGELAAAANDLNLWFKPSSWVLPTWVPTPARRRFRRAQRMLRDHARSLLSDAGDEPDEESLLATLGSLAAEPDNGFDREEVVDQVLGTLFAGHETTALATSYALHAIASHDEVQRRVHAELDDVLEGPATLEDVQRLSYLERVVHESLRLYPPIHGIPRKTVQPTTLGEHRLPAEEDVLIAVWAMHRDDRFYDDPLAFDPSRWADTSPQERGFEYVPFGGGPRICVGRHLARLELKVVLAAVCSRYELSAASDLEFAAQMTTQPDGPVQLRVEERS